MASESLLNQLRQSFYDENGNPNERLDRYCSRDVQKIVIDGNEFTGYKTYSFFWEKTYIKEPTRSSNGVIGNLNSYPTFITPHLKITFSLMSMEDYRRLYDLMLSKNEFTVTCYDTLTNTTTTNKMYFYPDELPKLVAIGRTIFNPQNQEKEKWVELLGMQDYTVEMVGTNVGLETVDILYYDENDNLIANATQNAQIGEEVIIRYNYTAPRGYMFENQWEDKNSSLLYTNGDVIQVHSTLSLRAVVVSTNQYQLSLDYGKGIKPQPRNLLDKVDNFQIVYKQSIGTAISNANITLSNGNTFAFPTQGTGVESKTIDGVEYSGGQLYEFKGWYWTTEEDIATRVNADTKFYSNFNRTIHQIYTPKQYTLTFVTNENGISIAPQTVGYSERVVLPILAVSGKTFRGWYLDNNSWQKQFNGTMLPTDTTIYAKWE